MLEGKIAGVPLVLILLVIAIAIVIDVPMALGQYALQQRLSDIANTQSGEVRVQVVSAPTSNVTPTMPVVSPTVGVKSTKAATPSGRLR